MSFQEVGGATNLRFSHKVIAVLMSIVVALGLCPIAKAPQAEAAELSAASAVVAADKESGTVKISLDKASVVPDGVVITVNGSATLSEQPAGLNSSPDLKKNASATLSFAAEGFTFNKDSVSITDKVTNKSPEMGAWNSDETAYSFKTGSNDLTVLVKEGAYTSTTTEGDQGNQGDQGNASPTFKVKVNANSTEGTVELKKNGVAATDDTTFKFNDSATLTITPAKDYELDGTPALDAKNCSPELQKISKEGVTPVVYKLTMKKKLTDDGTVSITVNFKSTKVEEPAEPAKEEPKPTTPEPAKDSDKTTTTTTPSKTTTTTTPSKTTTTAKTSIAKAKVTLKKASAAYTGKTQKGAVKSVKLGSKTLKAGTDYKVSAKSGKKVGSYKVTITGKGNYTGTKTVTFKIVKASQKISAKNFSVTYKGSKLIKSKKLKKNQTINVKSKAKASAKTTIKYAKVGKTGGKSIAVNAKTGKITVKKGLKAGTYKVKVKMTAAKNANYKAAKAKTITVTVKVAKK